MANGSAPPAEHRRAAPGTKSTSKAALVVLKAQVKLVLKKSKDK
jgi:hypothetical protein